MYNFDIYIGNIIGYKPKSLAKMNTVNNNIIILISREVNHLNMHESYLQVEFMVSDNVGCIIANVANVRLVKYGVRSLFSSIKLETIIGKTIEYIDHCHPNLAMFNFINSTGDEYESGFVSDQR